jgi:hypothetical protein
MPYLPEKADSDDDLDFDEDSDTGVRPQKKSAKIPATPVAIVQSVTASGGSRADLSLSLFLGGVISRPDLTSLVPSTKDLPVQHDPIGACRLRPQPPGEHEGKPDVGSWPRRCWSYRRSPNALAFKKFSAASIPEEFAENRCFIASRLCATLPHAGQNVDAKVSNDALERVDDHFLYAAYNSSIAFASVIALAHGRMHSGLYRTLADVYGPLRDEVFDYIKIATTPPTPVVTTIRRALVGYACRRYAAHQRGYANLCECAVRTFPAPSLIDRTLADLESITPDSAPLCSRLRELLSDVVNTRDGEVRISSRDLALLARFGLFFSRFVRTEYPWWFMHPPNCLAGASRDWTGIYEQQIRGVIRARGLREVDRAVERDVSEYMKALEKARKKIQELKDEARPATRLIACRRPQRDVRAIEIVALHAE